MKPILIFYVFIQCISLSAQDTIKFLGFENDTNAWKGAGIGIGSILDSSSILIGDTTQGIFDTPSDQRILSGSRSWQVNDFSDTILLDQITLSGYDSVRLKIRFTGTSKNPGQGLDVNDSIKIFVVIDSAVIPLTPSVVITSLGNNNGKWGYDADSIVKGYVDSQVVFVTPITNLDTLNTSSTILFSIPNQATSIRLMIVMSTTQNMEVWSMDDILLSGKKRIKLALKNNLWHVVDKPNHVEISWKYDGTPFKEIQLLRSSDGSKFNILQEFFYDFYNDQIETVYSDKTPFTGTNYYMIRVVNEDNTISFSDIKKILHKSTNEILLYPTQVENNLNIKFEKEFDGQYYIIGLNGKIIQKGYVVCDGAIINLKTNTIQPGFWILALRSKNTFANLPFIKK